jgi:hypothetical protein
MIERALRLIRSRRTARERAIVEVLAHYQNQHQGAITRTIRTPKHTTPTSITHALRGPSGQDQVVVLHHEGMTIKAVLHPAGRPDPDREAAVWRCIRDRASLVREEQL